MIHDGISIGIKPLVGAETIGNPTFLQIIRCHFQANLVTGEDVHAVDPHATRQVAEQFVILGLWTQDFDSERSIREGLFHDADEFNNILRHKCKKQEMAAKAVESYRG